MIGSIIILLLNQKGILEIPGLGTFKSEYSASNIQFATRTITPFTYQIEFSAKPTMGQTSDLQNYLVSEIGTSSEQALNYIETFVSEVNRALQTDRKYEIKDFGWLLLNIEGSTHFQMYQDFPYNLEAYGLKNLKAETVYSRAKVNPEREAPVIPLHPFDDEIPQAFEREVENKPVFKWASVAAVFIATIVSIGSVYLLSQQNFSSDSSMVVSKPMTQEATLVPVGKSAEETTINEPIAVTTSEALPEKKPTEVVINKAPETIKQSNTTFFVVAGSFQNESKSDKLHKTLLKKGFESDVLTKGDNGFIRVSIGKFTNKAEAISFLSTSQKDFDENLWVLTNP
jgi:cell division septation protein DedD